MRNIILHSHIFKNAGTTFDHCLKRNFGDDFADHRDDQDMVEGKISYLKSYLSKNQNIQAISSHSVHFMAVDDDEFNFQQIYFLRHPIERIKSVYTFEKKQPKDVSLGAKMAKELEFREYIIWRMRDDVAATIRNCQTIFLSGDGPGAENIDDKFDLSLSALENNSLIGVVDRFDESMVVFEEHLKDSFENIDLSYVRKNVTEKNLDQNLATKSEELLNQLDGELREIVLAKNLFDIKLYEAANEKLNMQIRSIDNFANKLESFRARSAPLNP